MSELSQSEQLARFLDRAHTGGRLALDTEFMGEGRYRTLLCLIQLAVPQQPGYDEEIAIFDPLDEQWWDEFTADPDEFLDAGSEVVVVGRYRGVAKATRKQLDVPFVHIWTVRDNKAIRFRQFLDTAGWVNALEI